MTDQVTSEEADNYAVVARLNDGRAGADQMSRDVQLAHHVLRIDAGRAARHARDDRSRPKVHEHVPRLAQDDRVVADDAVRTRNGDRRVYRSA